MTTTNPEGGDRLSIGDLQRKDAAKPFAERDRQRLTEAEIKQIIRRLPKPLSMTPLRIGVEISGFARDYLQMRRKEEASRPASRVQRDLKAVVSQLDKVVEWANGHKRRLSTDIPRLRKAIKQLEELANDESAGVALSLPLDEAVVPALKELQRVLETTTEKTNAPFDLSKTQDLRDFIRDSVAPHVEEPETARLAGAGAPPAVFFSIDSPISTFGSLGSPRPSSGVRINTS